MFLTSPAIELQASEIREEAGGCSGLLLETVRYLTRSFGPPVVFLVSPGCRWDPVSASFCASHFESFRLVRYLRYGQKKYPSDGPEV